MTCAPEHLLAKSEIHCFCMFCWNVEPWPEIDPLAQLLAPDELPVDGLLLLAVLLLLLPHPARVSAAAAATPASVVVRVSLTLNVPPCARENRLRR